MLHVDAVVSPAAPGGTGVGGEQEHIPPGRPQDVRLGLGPGHLLRQDELSPGIVLLRLVEEQDQLQGKINFPIEVLVQGVESTFPVLQDEYGGLVLPVVPANLEQGFVLRRIPPLLSQDLHPTVGDGGQVGIDAAADILYQAREGILEILVFAHAEPVALHADGLPVSPLRVVEPDQVFAFVPGEEPVQEGVALPVQVFSYLGPVPFFEALEDMCHGY
jgi:hypothetical protein